KIRKAEAALYHVRWVASRYAEKETEAMQGRLIGQLADATSLELKARALHEAKDAALKPLREADAAAAALVQRLTIAREQLEEEMRRADRARADLTDRRTQIATDLQRETALITEADSAVAALEEEVRELRQAAEDEEEASVRARQEAETARSRLAQAEQAAQDA